MEHWSLDKVLLEPLKELNDRMGEGLMWRAKSCFISGDSKEKKRRDTGMQETSSS